MHPSSHEWMSNFRLLLGNAGNVLDVGSRDTNGSYRDLFSGWDYTGLDPVPGKNVDYVPEEPYVWDFEDSTFDVVISGQTLEHIEFPAVTFMEIYRVLKDGGKCCIIAPSKGPPHNEPWFQNIDDKMMRKLAVDAGLKVEKIIVGDNDPFYDCVLVAEKNKVEPPKKLKLNLGSGKRKLAGFVNIDFQERCKPDVICNLAEGIPYPDNLVDEIIAIDFIEHLERHEVMKLMDEVYRVLKPKGTFYHRTPSSDGRGAWQDPTHKSAWNLNTWKYYFTDPAYRDLYGTVANFKILQLFDEVTDKENKVIHTHCFYEAVK